MKAYCPQPFANLWQLNLSKLDYFKKYDESFDSALPQQWLDAFADHSNDITYHQIVSTTVWAYESDYTGPVTCCTEVLEAFQRWESAHA